MIQCTAESPDKDAEIHTLQIGEAIYLSGKGRRIRLNLLCPFCGIQLVSNLQIEKITEPKADPGARTAILSLATADATAR